MKIRDILKEKETGFSLEFFPPKTAKGKDQFLEVVKNLGAYGPMYASITYGAGGSTRERTMNALEWVIEETELTVMSHLTCIGATKADMDLLLKDYIEMGIENILALRGDPPKDLYGFNVDAGEFSYARDLVEFIRRYGAFSTAVAVYPEGHAESPSLEKDMEYTKMKIDAGADFAITQMFFDNGYFFDFMDRAGKAGIDIPILPGIMPVSDIGKIREFATFCNATIPKSMEDTFAPVADKPEEMQRTGIEFAVRQCEDLMDNGVKYIHLYTLNKSESASAIIEAIAGRFA